MFRTLMLAAVVSAASLTAVAQPTSTVPPFGQTAIYKAYDLKAEEPKVSAEEWSKYDNALAKRADAVLKDLHLSDQSKADHVKRSVIDYYKFLRAWHDQHDAKLKKLNRNAKANAAAIEEERRDLTTAHKEFLADLSSILTPAQVETVKDRLCYRRPTIMYEGFTRQNPWLTREQKAQLKAVCEEARDKAMDGGSAKEKHLIMDKYKGRLTNFIAKWKKSREAGASGSSSTGHS